MLPHLIAALRVLGLVVVEDEAATGFVAGVRIADGGLRVAPTASPANLRPLAQDNLAAVWDAIHAGFAPDRCRKPDTPDARAPIQCSDPEATAWAFAFGYHCCLDPEEIIEDGDHDGEGTSVRLVLKANAYVPVHGLRHAGFLDQVRDFPRLKRWRQLRFEATGTSPATVGYSHG